METESLTGLVVFARIVKAGSLTAAAESLGLSRSAVSKKLTALESAVGARLLQRTTRRISLTEVGEHVLEQAVRAEGALAAVEGIADDYHRQVKGRLNVSCSSSLGRVQLVPLLKEFLSRYPQLEMNLQLEDRFVDLVEEQVDVAVRIGHLPDSSLVARPLGTLEWAVAASPDYLERAGKPKTPAELADHRCLYYRNKSASMHTWGFTGPQGEERVTVRGPLAMNDATALAQAAIDGLGVLLIDRAMMADALQQGKLVEVLTDYAPLPGLPVYAVYPAREHLPEKTRVFVEFLRQKLALSA